MTNAQRVNQYRDCIHWLRKAIEAAQEHEWDEEFTAQYQALDLLREVMESENE